MQNLSFRAIETKLVTLLNFFHRPSRPMPSPCHHPATTLPLPYRARPISWRGLRPSSASPCLGLALTPHCPSPRPSITPTSPSSIPHPALPPWRSPVVPPDGSHRHQHSQDLRSSRPSSRHQMGSVRRRRHCLRLRRHHHQGWDHNRTKSVTTIRSTKITSTTTKTTITKKEQ